MLSRHRYWEKPALYVVKPLHAQVLVLRDALWQHWTGVVLDTAYTHCMLAHHLCLATAFAGHMILGTVS